MTGPDIDPSIGATVGAEFQGKDILVVGLGASGSAAAVALQDLGAKVAVTDGNTSSAIQERASGLRSRGIEVELGQHALADRGHDLAIVSPGIPPTAPVLMALSAAGVPLWSEIELAFRLSSHRFLAITGTNGKTTATSLLAAMLEKAGVPSVAAGNIGLPALEAIHMVPPGGVIALEVSSFQLAAIDSFRPQVAVVLNIAEDHTDWHGSIEEYAAAKHRITENQTDGDVLLVNQNDPLSLATSNGSKAKIVHFSRSSAPVDGIGIAGDSLVWRGRNLMPAAEISLKGAAGLEDAVAAAGAALEFGLEVAPVVEALRSFEPLAHRSQLVATSDGISYIDDSKATNPHATLAAVEGLRDVILIAGGRSKGIDLTPLASTAPPVSLVIALGEAKDEIATVFEGRAEVVLVDSMEEAVAVAASRGKPGVSVLLSPGCASLDMYGSYAERGEHFARSVRQTIDRRKEDA